jgi:hypothetical protein
MIEPGEYENVVTMQIRDGATYRSPRTRWPAALLRPQRAGRVIPGIKLNRETGVYTLNGWMHSRTFEWYDTRAQAAEAAR